MTNATKPYTFAGFTIPDRMMLAIHRWVDHGIKPGDFLWAVICNDLRSAVAHADTENLRNLSAYVSFFYNETPQHCWGSVEKANAWRALRESGWVNAKAE